MLCKLTAQWRREYLTSLREQSSKCLGNAKSREVVEGDVVIVRTEATPRAFWRLARVDELLSGADGRVRAAIIRVSGDNGKVYTTRRVVHHLVPLEVPSSTAAKANRELGITESTPEAEPIHPEPSTKDGARPRRTVAIVGEVVRRPNSS